MLMLSHKIVIRSWAGFARRAALLVLFGCVLALPGQAAAPDSTIGSYRLIFRGCYSGEGTGTVNRNNVMIRGNLVDENGNRVNFVAPNLTLTGSHFNDEVTVGGRKIKVNGRVEARGGMVRKARLVCTFSVEGVGHGRVAGEHR